MKDGEGKSLLELNAHKTIILHDANFEMRSHDATTGETMMFKVDSATGKTTVPCATVAALLPLLLQHKGGL